MDDRFRRGFSPRRFLTNAAGRMEIVYAPITQQPMPMTRQVQFLLLVQTTLLAAAANRAGTEDPFRHERVLQLMDMALDAATHIPADETVRDAAIQFCSWALDAYERPEWLA